MPRAVALFSGGLDSMLAVRILQRQGFEVHALAVRTLFGCCRIRATQAAAELGVPLTVLSVPDDYLEVIRKPSHGYGRAVNPCVDCRIYLCKMAERLMEEVGACAVVTGEVLGQRAMSQKKRDLKAVATGSGLEGRLVRPLSAKLLPPTMPEREGLIDRAKLYRFNGRGRRELIELAGQLGIRTIPQPSTGCALTEVSFAPRIRDLLKFHPHATRWDFELLKAGRHLRFDEHTKVVVGRNAEDNARLMRLFQRQDVPHAALLHPNNFPGPDGLVVGRVSDAALTFAGALIWRYSRRADPDVAQVCITQAGATRRVPARPLQSTAMATPL